MSPVHNVLAADGRQEGVQSAVDAVRRGELIVLPTDTVYGVGADAFDAVAVQRLLEVKGRDRAMPPPVLVADTRTLDALTVQVPAYARALVERYWPGPLTVVLRSQPSLAWDLGDTNGTVALRMPDHEFALEVLAQTGPLAVSSANRSGRPAAVSVAEAAAQLGAGVEVYLDGGTLHDPGTGAGSIPLASTIVDCTRDRPVVLRAGPISVADIEACAAEAAEATAPTHPENPEESSAPRPDPAAPEPDSSAQGTEPPAPRPEPAAPEG